jgi:hypothetical protein
MNYTNLLPAIRLRALPTLLLLAVLVTLAGCTATLPALTADGTPCSMLPGEKPPQNAPDDCRREICRDGQLTSVEDLTETATVSDWAEEAFCFFHPLDCFAALSVRKEVRQWEQAMVKAGYWDQASLQGGLGDAARHGYLACRLVEEFGARFAQGLLEAHEEDSSLLFGFGTAMRGNRCCDKLMDLNNNRIGMELAHQPGDCQEKVLTSLPRFRHSLCAK